MIYRRHLIKQGTEFVFVDRARHPVALGFTLGSFVVAVFTLFEGGARPASIQQELDPNLQRLWSIMLAVGAALLITAAILENSHRHRALLLTMSGAGLFGSGMLSFALALLSTGSGLTIGVGWGVGLFLAYGYWCARILWLEYRIGTRIEERATDDDERRSASGTDS